MSGEAQRKRIRSLIRKAGVTSATSGEMETLRQAFTHESYAKEHGGQSNERLEFLGDSILGCVTASWAYEHFPDEPEGALTVRKAGIVNDAQLAMTARRLGFGEIVVLGAGMRNAGGSDNTSILADAFEAFVGALYLAYGLEAARRFVEHEHIERQELAASRGAHTELFDAKTRLQHYTQEHLAGTPRYRDEVLGTAQAPLFASRVEVNGKALGTGTGPSKKAAQQAAAQVALENIESRETTEA